VAYIILRTTKCGAPFALGRNAKYRRELSNFENDLKRDDPFRYFERERVHYLFYNQRYY
jgi:hypothetical protein